MRKPGKKNASDVRLQQLICRCRVGVGLALGLSSLGMPAARAQQVLVQANVAEDTLKSAFGPNRRYFGHGFVSSSLVAGPSERGAGVRYGLHSLELRVGGRAKLRLSQLLAFTFDLGYSYQRYELRQTSQKVVPTFALHQAENLGLHQLYAEFGLRLNAGRRGNTVGSYLDLLAGGGWVAGTSHTTTDEPGPGIRSVATTERGLAYLRRWTGGVGARLGFDRYALVGRYRLSPVFAGSGPAWPELPRWTVGIEVGLF